MTSIVLLSYFIDVYKSVAIIDRILHIDAGNLVKVDNERDNKHVFKYARTLEYFDLVKNFHLKDQPKSSFQLGIIVILNL